MVYHHLSLLEAPLSFQSYYYPQDSTHRAIVDKIYETMSRNQAKLDTTRIL